jgi:hypothetical protein
MTSLPSLLRDGDGLLLGRRELAVVLRLGPQPLDRIHDVGLPRL